MIITHSSKKRDVNSVPGQLLFKEFHVIYASSWIIKYENINYNECLFYFSVKKE